MGAGPQFHVDSIHPESILRSIGIDVKAPLFHNWKRFFQIEICILVGCFFALGDMRCRTAEVWLADAPS